MVELEYKIRVLMSKLKYVKNREQENNINDKYRLFTAVDEEGDCVYFSVNMLIDGELFNVRRISGCISVENNNFVFEVSTQENKAELQRELTVEELEQLDLIVYIVKDYLNNKIKMELQKLSGLSVLNKEVNYVWLNIMDGFSETWHQGEFGFNSIDEFLCSLPAEDGRKDKSVWKLIEYKCHNDHNFKFDKNMKLK